MSRRDFLFLPLLFMLGHAALLTPSAVVASPQVLIVCGSGGQNEYTAQFLDWGSRLQHILPSLMGIEPEAIFLLTEKSDPPSSLVAIDQAFDAIQQRLQPGEPFYLFLIGHGSSLRGESKLQIPGPDLQASWLKEKINDLTTIPLVLIHSGSASAGFINHLSAPQRILCTATKSVDENNATDFMAHFLEGLETGLADTDYDGRISVYEACSQAARLTQAAYQQKGHLASEHALLDDNGDGLGTRLVLDNTESPSQGPREDGHWASQTFIQEYRFPEGIPQEWITAYRDALHAVEQIKVEKDSLREEEYYKKLEKALLQAARINQKIQAAASP